MLALAVVGVNISTPRFRSLNTVHFKCRSLALTILEANTLELQDGQVQSPGRTSPCAAAMGAAALKGAAAARGAAALPSGFGVLHRKQHVFDANTFALHLGHIQSPSF